MPIQLVVPLLRVADVRRSLEWYRGVLGFVGDPFPETPPYQFAILRHGSVELMLRCGDPPPRTSPRQYDWDVYLRLEDTPFREVYAKLHAAGLVTRRLERMFYGLAEFELTDPDGYAVCLSQFVENADDLPTPVV
ncbi:MAG TPA: VOC family protein [Planctomycetaceae bacterium]|nr:VOC family protein [Planctomycetaceae bacterium]